MMEYLHNLLRKYKSQNQRAECIEYLRLETFRYLKKYNKSTRQICTFA